MAPGGSLACPDSPSTWAAPCLQRRGGPALGRLRTQMPVPQGLPGRTAQPVPLRCARSQPSPASKSLSR